MIGAGNDRQFDILCANIGRVDISENPKFLSNALRVANREELLNLIQNELSKQTTQYWLDVFDGKGMPYAAVKFLYPNGDEANGVMSKRP